MGNRLSMAVHVGQTIAKATIASRRMRRRLLAQMLGVIVVFIALGSWPLAHQLSKSPVLFLCWWGFVAGLTIVMGLLAVIDILRVPHEEKAKILKRDLQSLEKELRDKENCDSEEGR